MNNEYAIYRDGIAIPLTLEECMEAAQVVAKANLLAEAKEYFVRLFSENHMDEFERLEFQDEYGFRPEDVYDEKSKHFLLHIFAEVYESMRDMDGVTPDSWNVAISNVLQDISKKRRIPVSNLWDHIQENYNLDVIAPTVIQNCIAFAREHTCNNDELQDLLKDFFMSTAAGADDGIDEQDLDRVIFDPAEDDSQ